MKQLWIIAGATSLAGASAFAGDLGPAFLLHDNGEPDGVNGYSNATAGVLGSRRTLLDDFVVPPDQIWVVKRLHWNHLWSTLDERGTGVEIELRSGVDGAPGDPLQTLTITGYDEMLTGDVFFERAEVESWATFEAVALTEGHYWFDATIVGEENNFWLTASPIQHSECWINYEDLGGLQSGTKQFGAAADLAWSLEGAIAGTGSGACCLVDGQCVEIAFVDCDGQGGVYQGDDTDCVLQTCGTGPGACCLPDGTCAVQGDLFCAAFEGFFAGAGVSCEGFDCAPDGVCGVFAPRESYGVPSSASEVVLGDIDGDGDLDAVIRNAGSAGRIDVFKNNGDGTFASATSRTTGSRPRGLALGDFDGDLDLDLAVTISDNDEVAVHPNDGDGTFADATTFPVGTDPRDVEAGDLDGDLDLDLVVVNADDNTVSVLLNDGNGVFGAATTSAVGAGPQDIGLGDLDGDLDEDLFVGNAGGSSVSVLLNDGAAGFAPQMTFDLIAPPNDLALADLDGDLDLDAAVTTLFVDGVSLLLNQGDGTFAPEVRYALPNPNGAITLADLDGDDDIDVALNGALFPEIMTTLFNNGDAVFGPATTFDPGQDPIGLASGDLDDDGDVDLVLCNDGIDAMSVFKNRCVPCREDLDGSGAVDFADILVVLAAWGTAGGPADLDGSGVVDLGDLIVLLVRWGVCG